MAQQETNTLVVRAETGLNFDNAMHPLPLDIDRCVLVSALSGVFGLERCSGHATLVASRGGGARARTY